MQKLVMALAAAAGAAYLVVRQQEKKADVEARRWAEAAGDDPHVAPPVHDAPEGQPLS